MNRWIFRLLLVAMIYAGVAAALVIRKENGYVLLQFGTWQVETSLVLLIVAVLTLFFLLYILVSFLLGTVRAPGKLRSYAHDRSAVRARKELVTGLMELAEGRWEVAEKRLTKHVGDSDTPLLNYLGAARAAQLQGAEDRRDEYLSAAQSSTPRAETSVLITQAELQLEQERNEEALATLQSLHGTNPDHRYVLRQLYRIYQAEGDWSQLKPLLPKLKKQKIIDAEQMAELEVAGYRHSIEQANANGDSSEPARAELAGIWQLVPQKLRQHPELVKSYAAQLHRAGGEDSAASLIEGFLRRHWDEGLANLYGLLQTSDLKRQLNTSESWLRAHDDSPALLLALGRLSMRNELWGKARSYLDASIAAGPKPETYQELGLLLQSLDEPDAAREAFRNGLSLGLVAENNTAVALPAGGPPALTQSEPNSAVAPAVAIVGLDPKPAATS